MTEPGTREDGLQRPEEAWGREEEEEWGGQVTVTRRVGTVLWNEKHFMEL